VGKPCTHRECGRNGDQEGGGRFPKEAFCTGRDPHAEEEGHAVGGAPFSEERCLTANNPRKGRRRLSTLSRVTVVRGMVATGK
jgi:hypothetical protein